MKTRINKPLSLSENLLNKFNTIVGLSQKAHQINFLSNGKWKEIKNLDKLEIDSYIRISTNRLLGDEIQYNLKKTGLQEYVLLSSNIINKNNQNIFLINKIGTLEIKNDNTFGFIYKDENIQYISTDIESIYQQINYNIPSGEELNNIIQNIQIGQYLKLYIPKYKIIHIFQKYNSNKYIGYGFEYLGYENLSDNIPDQFGSLKRYGGLSIKNGLIHFIDYEGLPEVLSYADTIGEIFINHKLDNTTEKSSIIRNSHNFENYYNIIKSTTPGNLIEIQTYGFVYVFQKNSDSNFQLIETNNKCWQNLKDKKGLLILAIKGGSNLDSIKFIFQYQGTKNSIIRESDSIIININNINKKVIHEEEEDINEEFEIHEIIHEDINEEFEVHEIIHEEIKINKNINKELEIKNKSKNLKKLRKLGRSFFNKEVKGTQLHRINTYDDEYQVDMSVKTQKIEKSESNKITSGKILLIDKNGNNFNGSNKFENSQCKGLVGSYTDSNDQHTINNTFVNLQNNSFAIIDSYGNPNNSSQISNIIINNLKSNSENLNQAICKSKIQLVEDNLNGIGSSIIITKINNNYELEVFQIGDGKLILLNKNNQPKIIFNKYEILNINNNGEIKNLGSKKSINASHTLEDKHIINRDNYIIIYKTYLNYLSKTQGESYANEYFQGLRKHYRFQEENQDYILIKGSVFNDPYIFSNYQGIRNINTNSILPQSPKFTFKKYSNQINKGDKIIIYSGGINNNFTVGQLLNIIKGEKNREFFRTKSILDKIGLSSKNSIKNVFNTIIQSYIKRMRSDSYRMDDKLMTTKINNNASCVALEIK